MLCCAQLSRGRLGRPDGLAAGRRPLDGAEAARKSTRPARDREFGAAGTRGFRLRRLEEEPDLD